MLIVINIGSTIFAFKVQVWYKPLFPQCPCLYYASVIPYWHAVIDRPSTNSPDHYPSVASVTSYYVEPTHYIINLFSLLFINTRELYNVITQPALITSASLTFIYRDHLKTPRVLVEQNSWKLYSGIHGACTIYIPILLFLASWEIGMIHIFNRLTAEDELFCVAHTSLAKNALRSIWPQKTTSGKRGIYPFKLQTYLYSTASLYPVFTSHIQKLLIVTFYCYFSAVVIHSTI